MATRLALYLHADDSLVTSANPIPLTWAGSTPAATVLDFYNDRDGDGADDAVDRYLITKWRVVGSGLPFVAAGLPPADDQYLEGRIVAPLGTLGFIATTGWTPIGAGSGLEYPTLASTEGFQWELRPRLPIEALTEEYEFIVTSPGPESMALGRGFSESAGADGILSGLGDYRATGAWIGSPTVEDPGGPSDQVLMSDFSYQITGVPYGRVAQKVTVYGPDANSDALATGEAFYSVISLPADGGPSVFTVTPGVKTAAALTPADIPQAPAGEIRWSLVAVRYDAGGGAIEDADITHLGALTGFAPSDSGATRTVTGGRARVDNCLITRQASQSIAVPLSSTSAIYMRRTGNLTDEAELGALLLADGVVTDGSGIADAGVDRRVLVGHRPVEWAFNFDVTLDDSPGTYYAYAAGAPLGRDVYLLPLDPFLAWLDSLPSGVTAGRKLTIEVQYSTPGASPGAWTSLWTSSGSRDMRAHWADDATDPMGMAAADSSMSPHPDVRIIPAGSRLRAKAVSDMDGTAPTGARCLLRGGF